MSERLKSSLYLAAFILASIIYYNETNAEQAPEATQMASADIEQVSNAEVVD
ncbi:hypothetical protein ACFSSG_00125 [Euzebyella marina]|uniref:hypothetical protein n=1 Tax=Euzebyella marina TaxID=1761453 RepID=UPI0013CED62F|nr:hypothetical protein [Euzebyella marina]|tara:strand:- start:279 stop:434 length:156 start_codon:yes stop_codon:yes gene_type:complete